jgi:tRNA threonylcarbamoyladenosine biosynthesis protein TsaB
MSLILSIETSTMVCSVALHRNNYLIALNELFEEKSHSKSLLLQISQLLKHTGYRLDQLDAIAVSKGPGSYTGLRIGVSTAKGLCYAIDKPLISVNTLEAMGIGINKWNIEQYYVCPMIDARRMEVYCCLLNSSNTLIIPTRAEIVNQNFFNELLKSKKIIFFGNGSDKCKDVLKENTNASFLSNIHPSAANIGYLAYHYFQRGEFENLAHFEPYYLKEFLTTKSNGNYQ